MTQLDTAHGLADALSVSVALIRKLTRLTDLPRIKIGRSVRYDRGAVMKWLQERQEQMGCRQE